MAGQPMLLISALFGYNTTTGYEKKRSKDDKQPPQQTAEYLHKVKSATV